MKCSAPGRSYFRIDAGAKFAKIEAKSCKFREERPCSGPAFVIWYRIATKSGSARKLDREAADTRP